MTRIKAVSLMASVVLVAGLIFTSQAAAVIKLHNCGLWKACVDGPASLTVCDEGAWPVG